MTPTTLTLPADTPHVPLHRHENLYWMRSQPLQQSRQPASSANSKSVSSPTHTVTGEYPTAIRQRAPPPPSPSRIPCQDEESAAAESRTSSGSEQNDGTASTVGGAPGEEAVAEDLAITTGELSAHHSVADEACRTPFGSRIGYSAAGETYLQCRENSGTAEQCAAAALVTRTLCSLHSRMSAHGSSLSSASRPLAKCLLRCCHHRLCRM